MKKTRRKEANTHASCSLQLFQMPIQGNENLNDKNPVNHQIRG